jgi:hypothetical protein
LGCGNTSLNADVLLHMGISQTENSSLIDVYKWSDRIVSFLDQYEHKNCAKGFRISIMELLNTMDPKNIHHFSIIILVMIIVGLISRVIVTMCIKKGRVNAMETKVMYYATLRQIKSK